MNDKANERYGAAVSATGLLEPMMTNADRQLAPFFYGLQPRWLSGDSLYRVYVSETMIAGAYIAGQIYDERSAAFQLQQLHPFLRGFVRRRLEQRQDREAVYDSVGAFAHSFLSHDRRNFQIPRSDVVRARFRRSRSLWAPINVGVVELEMFGGETRRFILVGNQEPDEILRTMRVFDPAIAVTGTPSPLPKPPTPGMRRFAFLGLATMLVASTILFAYVAMAGLVRPRLGLFSMVLAVCNLPWRSISCGRRGRFLAAKHPIRELRSHPKATLSRNSSGL